MSDRSFWSPIYLEKSAWLEHAPFAFWITDILKPRAFVELGTHRGYSYFAFCQAVSMLRLETQCFAVDTWQGDEHAGFYGEEIFTKVDRYNQAHYREFSRLLRCTFDQALSELSDDSVDLLHIDGRHFYDDVSHDFESWKPKLSDRAIVLFHDTNVKDHRDFGVHELWSQVSKKYPTFEFLHGHGLGVLAYGADIPAGLSRLFDLQQTQSVDAVRRAYACLGGAIRDGFRLKNLEADLAASRRSVAQKNKDLAEADAELRQRDRVIASLIRSSSWRITAPLRVALAGSRRLLGSPRHQSGTQASKNTGAWSISKRALRAYQMTVPAGIRARVPNGAKRAILSRMGFGSQEDKLMKVTGAAETAMKSKQWNEAAELWTASMKLAGANTPPAVYAKLSRAYRLLGNLDKAEAVAHGVQEKHSMHPLVLVAKADIATARRDWTEAVSRWRLVMELPESERPPKAYVALSQAYRKLGDLEPAGKLLQQGRERFPGYVEIRAELAKLEMARGNWQQAVRAWTVLLENLDEPGLLRARARLEKSVAERLANLPAYQEHVDQYVRRNRELASDPNHTRVTVYTAIVSNYDTLKLPHRLDERIEYVVYSDSPQPSCSIFSVRPITYLNTDPTRSARYVKTHPHLLLDDCDVAVWIDSNICILGDIYPLIESFLASKEVVAGIRHPLRTCMYEEAGVCLGMGKDCSAAIDQQVNRYRAEAFDCEDLVESNVMMFDLRDERVKRFLSDWWSEIEKGSKRDQLSLNFALRKNALSYYRLMEPPQSARDHPSFALIRHDAGEASMALLTDALDCSDVSPYAGRPYSEVREERVASRSDVTIDIVVCVHNALDDVKACFASIESARKSELHRLIIVDDGSDTQTAQFLEGFAQANSWASLYRNEIAQGYTRAANRGLSVSTGDLVVILNSDTIVTEFWAEKLADAVISTPGAGIVGPMSNAASYQSIPEHRGSKSQTAINALPRGVTAEDMSRLCEKWTVDGILPVVPLIHGFCFGITRDTIDRIGLLDEERFPRGYGEENDYCFRALEAGIGLVVATHTYVFHSKSKSFEDEERIPLMKAGSKVFRDRYGDARVRRATESMDKNPLLERMRRGTARQLPKSDHVPLARPDLGEALQSGEYDFLDLGSSEGGSLSLAKAKLGGERGIGIDRSPEKVRTAKSKGFEVIQADALDLHGYPNAVSFVTMNHFLEHLPGIREARQCIEAASVVARDFVFIKHPWFDSDGELFRLGLKLYWSNWRGHPNHMTTLELHECISSIRDVDRWAIYGRDQIFDSIHSAIHPVASPDDQHAWEADIHPPKPTVEFNFPVYRETVCLIQMAGSNIDANLLLKGFSGLQLIHESSNGISGR